MRPGLLAWQWRLYADNHHDRANLALHIVSNPLFLAGLGALVVGPFLVGKWALLGLAAMLVALIAQGRGHRREETPPIPFTGPLDFVSRFLAEQLITFPRFVLSGGFLKAWRQAG